MFGTTKGKVCSVVCTIVRSPDIVECTPTEMAGHGPMNVHHPRGLKGGNRHAWAEKEAKPEGGKGHASPPLIYSRLSKSAQGAFRGSARPTGEGSAEREIVRVCGRLPRCAHTCPYSESPGARCFRASNTAVALAACRVDTVGTVTRSTYDVLLLSPAALAM